MTIDDIALTLHFGLGNKGIAHLLSVLGSAGAIFDASLEELVGQAQLKHELAAAILRKETHKQAEREMKYIAQNRLSAVVSTDPDYPGLLLECPDYPHVLYVKGNVEVLRGRMLSVVGTRAITPYGQRMYDILIGRVSELAGGTVIVSGLAAGGDANAHKAALDYGLPTVAVLANVLPEVTPAHNARLAEEIVAKGGALITELHSQTKQNGAFFIPRNRIIAGVSEGTVVVESALDGGSMRTATYADGYNRVLMAVPGRAGDRCSQGTNMLIKQRKASMVCSGDDIIYELGWNMDTPGRIPPKPVELPLLSSDERRIVVCFGEGEAIDLDTVSSRSGIPVGQVSGLLMGLEIAGVVRLLPGKIYELA